MLHHTGLASTTRHLYSTAQSVTDGIKRIELTATVNRLRRQHNEVEHLLAEAQDKIVRLQQENQRLKRELRKNPKSISSWE